MSTETLQFVSKAAFSGERELGFLISLIGAGPDLCEGALRPTCSGIIVSLIVGSQPKSATGSMDLGLDLTTTDWAGGGSNTPLGDEPRSLPAAHVHRTTSNPLKVIFNFYLNQPC